MAWKSQTEAAELLGISERTLSRRISAGMLETRRDGRRVLVNVGNAEEAETPVAEVAEIGRQLAEVATSAAIEKAHYGDLMADIRRISDSHVRQAREEAGRAWKVGYVAGMMAIVLTVVSGWLVWMIYSEAIEHNRQIVHLTTGVSLERGKTESLTQALTELRGDLEQSRTVVLQAKGQVAAVEAERVQLRADLDEARTARDALSAQVKAAKSRHRVQEGESEARIATLVGRNEELVRQIQELRLELEQSEASRVEVGVRLAETRAETDQLRSELEAALARNEGAVTDAREFSEKYEAKMLELTEQLARVRKRSDVLADALQKTWNDVEDWRSRHDDIQRQLAQEREVSIRLQADLATAEAERLSAVDQCRGLQEQVHHLRQEAAARPNLLDQLRAVFASPLGDEKRTAAR